MADSPDDLMAKFGDAVENEAPAEAAPVTPPVEAPTAQAEEPTVDEPVTEPTAEEPQAEPTEPTEPTAEDPTEPAAEPTPPVDPDEAAGRYRLKGKLAAVAQLTKEGMSEAEAIERVYGKSPTTPTEPAELSAPVEDPVAKLETELADVRTKLKSAAAEGVLYNDELDALNERRSELLIEIREAKGAKAQAEAQAQQSEDEQFDAEWQSESATLAEWYGDAAKDDGALGRVFLEEGSKAAKDPSHRFHRHWQSGTFTPLTIGPLLAAELNISRVSKAAAPAAPQSPPPSPRVLPVSGSARTTPPPVNNAAVAEAQRRERIAKATSPDDIEAVFAEANGGMTSRGSGFRLA